MRGGEVRVAQDAYEMETARCYSAGRTTRHEGYAQPHPHTEAHGKNMIEATAAARHLRTAINNHEHCRPPPASFVRRVKNQLTTTYLRSLLTSTRQTPSRHFSPHSRQHKMNEDRKLTRGAAIISPSVNRRFIQPRAGFWERTKRDSCAVASSSSPQLLRPPTLPPTGLPRLEEMVPRLASFPNRCKPRIRQSCLVRR
jgi:hypothetical protein